MTPHRRSESRSVFAGVAFISLLVIIVGFGLMLFLHYRWASRIELCRSTYRDVLALTILQEDALPLWQVEGASVTLFETTTAAAVVEESLNQRYALLMREGVQSGDLRSLPARNWVVESTDSGARVTVTCE